MRNLLLLTFILFSAFSTAADKPNFVVVLADDVSWDSFGFTGAEWARTPNIDKLAETSLYLSRFYCSVSQCAPLRAEMYTGLLPNNNGVLGNAKKIKRSGVMNIADHLRPLGYRVGWTGKKHFGLGKKRLDSINGFPGNCNASKQSHSMDGVREYIKSAVEADDPFCVFICSIHPHHPWNHGDDSLYPRDKLNLPPHYIDTVDTRNATAKHAAEVEVFDKQVGETVEMLRSLKLEDNTILIVLSEQGIAMPRGKWSPYEYGSRSVCLVRWPKQIEPRQTDAIAMYCDLVPTLIDLGGGNAVDSLDGTSLRKVWLNKSDTHRDAAFISNVHPFWQKAIVRKDYKLIWTAQPEQEHIFENFISPSKFFARPWAEWLEAGKADPTAASKLKRVLHPAEFELYRVDQDPYEINDLAPKHPDTVKRLHSQLKELMKASGESTTPPA